MLLTLLVPAWALARDLAHELIEAAHVAPDQVSLLVLDPMSRPALTWRANEPQALGSVMKLVTTLAALETLGPRHQFSTEFLFTPEGRRWRLFIRGGGDVEFRSKDLEAVVAEIKSHKITTIMSPITLDLRRFSEELGNTTGIDLPSSSMSGIPPSALSLDFGAIELQRDALGHWQANPPFPVFVDHRTDALTCGEDAWDAVALMPDLKRQRLNLQGNPPKICPPMTLRRAPLEGLTQFKWGMVKAWPAMRDRQWQIGEAPSYAPIQIVHLSPPLSEWVRDINTYSNNVAARTLLLQLAAESGDLPARPAGGISVVQHWLASHGWVFPEFQMENGSGLSHRETLSAQHLAEVLKYALTSAYHADFIGSLAIPGQEGTLAHRFVSLQRPSQWHLKTGRLDGVRGLAGVYYGQSGPWVLVCLINGPDADRSTALQDLLLQHIESKDLLTITAPEPVHP